MINNDSCINEIRDEKGNVIARIHGDINIDIVARALLGMKQQSKNSVD